MRRRRFAAAFFLFSILLPAAALPLRSPAAEKTADRREVIRRGRLMLKEAVRQIRSGELDSASTNLESILAEDPKNADAFYHAARVLVRRGDTTAAVARLEDGVRAAPLSSRLKLFLARLRIAAGDLDGAGELVGKVLAIKPREAEALYLKGWILVERGDTAGAADAWHEALRFTLERGGA